MIIKTEITPAPDCAELAAIHAACFPRGWDADALAAMLAIPGTQAVVATQDATTAGFGILRHVGDDAEILTLAVLESWRRRGIARQIVSNMQQVAAAQGANCLFLEVGANKAAALALYTQLGFAAFSRRPHYYRLGDGEWEDAVVMRQFLLEK